MKRACLTLGLIVAACSDSTSQPASDAAVDAPVVANTDSGTSTDGSTNTDAGGDSGGGSDAAADTPTRIYATFVTHNEQSNNIPCKDVVDANKQSEYLSNRTATIAFAKAIADAGGAYDLMSDMDYIDQINRFDSASVMGSTGGKNLFKYLNEFAPGKVTVDMHSHEKSGVGGFNSADVAEALGKLGVPANGVVGGFIANPAKDENWTRLAKPMKALRSSYEWTAKVLWGAGSGNHVNDPVASGVWRPKSPDEFMVDDPAQALPNIGGYADITKDDYATKLTALIDLLKTSKLEKNRMYTITLMTPQCNLHRDAALTEKAKSTIAAHTADVAAGLLVWTTVPDALNTWKTAYKSQPVILPR
jgi:hypothetical protein